MKSRASSNTKINETQIAFIDGVRIGYQDLGDEQGEAIVLVMGLGRQLIDWNETFVGNFMKAGYRVLLLDNRDAGFSEKYHNAASANVLKQIIRAKLGMPVTAPYRVSDMAQDTLSLLDHLGVQQAFVAGASLGGMICQQLAIDAPDRVTGLISIMSTTGARHLPLPRLNALRLLVSKVPNDATKAQIVDHVCHILEEIGSPVYHYDRADLRRTCELGFERGYSPAGRNRQLLAVIGSEARDRQLERLNIPSLVIHGEKDPLIRVEHGIHTAHVIPDSELHIIDEMGHGFEPVIAERLVGIMLKFMSRHRKPQQHPGSHTLTS